MYDGNSFCLKPSFCRYINAMHDATAKVEVSKNHNINYFSGIHSFKFSERIESAFENRQLKNKRTLKCIHF